MHAHICLYAHFLVQFNTFHVVTIFRDRADTQRQLVCDAAEQLQDRGKLLGKSVAVRDDSATIAKMVFNSIASQAVAKTPFMSTPPLPYLIKRAHAAATQEHLTESIALSSAVQLRSRSGGQGLVKRRGSVSC